MTSEEAIKRIENLIKGREDQRGKTELDFALDMALEALKEMSHLHLICPYCLKDFYYNKTTQSFELKEGEEGWATGESSSNR